MLSVTVCSLKRVRRSSSCREGEWQTTLPCTDLICVCIFTPYSEEGKTMFSLRVPGSLRTSVTWAFWAFWFSQDSYPFIVFPFSRWQQALDYFQSMLWGWKRSGFQFWNNSAVAWTSISPESEGRTRFLICAQASASSHATWAPLCKWPISVPKNQQMPKAN